MPFVAVLCFCGQFVSLHNCLARHCGCNGRLNNILGVFFAREMVKLMQNKKNKSCSCSFCIPFLSVCQLSMWLFSIVFSNFVSHLYLPCFVSSHRVFKSVINPRPWCSQYQNPLIILVFCVCTYVCVCAYFGDTHLFKQLRCGDLTPLCW